ncbi:MULTISPECIES: hypothetical protein [unclassified Streptomyces]|uniref:hypothetical protein n=1 Tax=unclassified Streptomyces TaxID=2593676 RepID=UPI00136FDFDD|nr:MULTISPECIES: hypothetical protein [unclassified Streptomyces]NDZ99327.1 hypothetical protein [Streptomyces sp. SID10116]MYY82561.1 hypothetical protein [Streptomyces sp. SID335]MYZ18804.1 hypothetical protein [Streptomyces sp. SID337]NDZ89608.1 hypothetical protein [Streptomyces sp. SID10115]NEB45250.1 hypothetical protein [Streptomyces sp. SID339]
MLSKLFGRGGERPEAADPHALPAPRKRKNGTYTLRALGDTRVLALVEAADSGDWDAVKAALGPFDLGRDHAVLDELADVDGLEEWIGRAVQDDKEHRATALLISGARHIIWGWEARTTARAAHVTREQWQIFYERLRIAEEQLLEAAELRPEWVTPWRRLLTSGRGMSVGADVSVTRFHAALRRVPLDLEAHLEWLSQLQPRWAGEPGQALAFARDALAHTPQGHRLGCVIAMAHIEEWVESDRGDCLETPYIQAELRKAADHSILHPAYVRCLGWQQDFHIFAMALSLADERHTVRRVLQALDGAYTSWPWKYFSEPEKQFAAAHRRAA